VQFLDMDYGEYIDQTSDASIYCFCSYNNLFHPSQVFFDLFKVCRLSAVSCQLFLRRRLYMLKISGRKYT
jgi:hypothetical protein